MFPVRWMAPESLNDGIFGTFSDIWSYGVLLYEIMTFGSYPYQGLSNRQVLNYVKAGNTIAIPRGCPPKCPIHHHHKYSTIGQILGTWPDYKRFNTIQYYKLLFF